MKYVQEIGIKKVRQLIAETEEKEDFKVDKEMLYCWVSDALDYPQISREDHMEIIRILTKHGNDLETLILVYGMIDGLINKEKYEEEY